MRPWISVDQLIADTSKEEATYAFRAKLWADYLVPPHGIRLDQRRIGDRFLELLAEQNRPRPRVRTRSTVSAQASGVVDEIHEWREVGYTAGGGTLWHAPLKRDRAQGWSKATPSAAVEEYREVIRAVVEQLADESGVPRELLLHD